MRLQTNVLTAFAIACALAVPSAAAPVKTANGPVEGTKTDNGIQIFRGIPFAAPPVGDLRWKPPQPVENWTAVRAADKFAANCMQRRVFGDMNFRSSGMSEDCLYLNVWTPKAVAGANLPVLVYFYGGGYIAGDGSEPRYDGETMARKGIVALTVNYRLGVFGFLAHPELTKESPNHASGNYGLLDQVAALQWVQKNIAAFGGDPRKVTIAGESAGSISVSALMVSPLSKGLIAGAIGESGGMIEPTLAPVPLAEGEKNGVAYATAIGAPSLAELRALPADKLLEATAKPGLPRLPATVDGWFLPKLPVEILAAGEQAHVPLLAGWNSEEQGARSLLAGADPTPENYAAAVKKAFPDNADQILKAYPATSNDQVIDVATALASDRFIAYSTWKWLDLHGRTGGKPTYRYFYSRPRPAMTAAMGNATPGLAGGVMRGNEAPAARPPAPRGAVHSAEIEYAMGNLATNKVYAWTPEDEKVSETFQGYFANFVKTGNPNGAGLPKWPAANEGAAPSQFLKIDVETKAMPDTTRDRYLVLDQIFMKKP